MSNTPAFPKEPPFGYIPAEGATEFERDLDSHDTAELINEAGTELKAEASKKVNELRRDAGQVVENVKERAAEEWHSTSERARELQVTVEDYVRHNPTKSVAIAAGTGLLLGLIMRR